MAEAQAPGVLTEMCCPLGPNKVRQVHRQEHIRLTIAEVIVDTAKLAALVGEQGHDLPGYVTRLADGMAIARSKAPQQAITKLEAARASYRFAAG